MNRRNRLLLRSVLVALAAGNVSQAQIEPPRPEPIVGARYPALSADGKTLAFVYRGDIWLGAATGGKARPLTSHVEYDCYPVFSPDGHWIAYGSKRHANWDVFVMPVEGGRARQITWHSGHDIPTGWSPDGKEILFSTKRDTPNYLLLAVDVGTLKTRRLAEDYARMNYASYSPDGKRLVYSRYGFPDWRPRYTGAAAAEIWLLVTQDGSRQPVRSNDRQHLWPAFMPDGKRLVTVTTGEETPSASPLDQPTPKIADNPAKTPNLWTVTLDGDARQLTDFSGGAVRCPSVASKSGDIAFEYRHDLYLLKSGRKQPAKIELFANGDEKQNTEQYEKLNNGASEAEPSPDGKWIAFAAKGDIWTILVEKPKGIAGRDSAYARRLTEWAGDDSDFMWSKDGKTLYFTSDREFNTRIYEMALETLKVTPLWSREEEVTHPIPSPDGQQLGFWVAGPEGGLHLMDLEKRESRRLVRLPGPHYHGYGGGIFSWSPDGRWIAYVARSESRAHNIFIVSTAGGDPANVTRLFASHDQPAWSPDGKYLFFQSNRDGSGLYVLPLQPEPVLASETDLKFVKPKEAVKVEIDFKETTARIRKVTGQNPSADLTVTAEGLIVFISDGDVWSVSYDGKETKRLTTGGGKALLRLPADGKKCFFVEKGELYQMKLPDGKPEKVPFTIERKRNIRDERRAAFTQFWRVYNRAFYDGNFHGRDWEAIRKQYEPLLEAIDTADEFAALLQSMVGELEASHSEVTAATGENPNATTPHLGFTFDYLYHGPGLKVAEVPEDAPGYFEKSKIKPGELILEINQQPVTLDETLYEMMSHKEGREFEFLVNDRPEKEGARTVKYKVLSSKEFTDLAYNNRIRDLRKRVETKTDGKIGYLHISAMGSSNQAQFEREAYEYIAGKEAMIIDVRFNRGGNISDTLIDWLERKQHGWFRGRDSQPDPSPARAWEKPVVVLLNEHSYSNGEMFPYAMRQRGLAKLVGMPTPGYVIWTSNFKLVDGTGARLPLAGVYRLDGSNQENHGERPDVRVPLTPDDWLAGRDPQLDKAIEMLTRRP